MGRDLPGVAWINSITAAPGGGLIATCTLEGGRCGFLRAGWPVHEDAPGPWCPDAFLDALMAQTQPAEHDFATHLDIQGDRLVLAAHTTEDEQTFCCIVQARASVDGWHPVPPLRLPGFASAVRYGRDGVLWACLRGETDSRLVRIDGERVTELHRHSDPAWAIELFRI